MKKLLASGGLLAFAALLLGSSTFAWFSMNKTVTATGMKVKAKTDASMVISATFPDSNSKSFSLDFEDSKATELLPSTHDDTYGTYTYGLKYVKNTNNVDPVTGKAINTTTGFTYDPVTSTNKASYFVDYSCYIAARGGSLTGQNLTVKINGSSVSNVNGAVSADFYMKKVTKSEAEADPSIDITASGTNYKGFLNAGQKDASGKNKSSFVASSIDIPPVDGTDGGKNALKVTIRVYVDGALPSAEGGNYFINDQNAIQVADTTIGFEFTASNPSK